MKHLKHYRDNGFTLIELLVAIIIIVVIVKLLYVGVKTALWAIGVLAIIAIASLVVRKLIK